MQAVLDGEEVVNLGSIHGNAADMRTMTGPGRMEIAKEELESRAGDLSRIADKGKGKGEGQVEEEEPGSSPDLSAGQVAIGMGDQDLFVDFGTKVERTSTGSRAQLKSPSRSISSSMPQSGVKTAAVNTTGQARRKSLSSEVEERIRKGSSPASRDLSVHTVAAATSSLAGLEPARDSRNSTPIIDKDIPRSPAPTTRISGKPTKVDNLSPAPSSNSTTKNVVETETGGGMATSKKEKKKRTTDIDDLFGGLVPGGKEAGIKKRKVDDQPALGAELVAVEKLEAVSTPAEVSKSKLKRAPDAGKVKLKKKKKKGDDLDDIFGF
jgi:hypothetical protein